MTAGWSQLSQLKRCKPAHPDETLPTGQGEGVGTSAFGRRHWRFTAMAQCRLFTRSRPNPICFPPIRCRKQKEI